MEIQASNQENALMEQPTATTGTTPQENQKVLTGTTSPKPSGSLLEDIRPVKLQLVEDMGPNGVKTGKIRVRGEFARVDASTENKRKYPRALVEREIARLQTALQHRQVFGELDHPCLISPEFTVLCVDGWKPFRDVKAGDKVWSRVDGRATVSTVTGIIDQPYDGPAYQFKGRSIESGFTPAHKHLLINRPGDSRYEKDYYAFSEEIFSDRKKYGHSAIPKTAVFFSESPKTVTIPSVKGVGPTANGTPDQDLVLDARAFAAFLGIYLAEGHCTSDKAEGYGVVVSQKNSWSRNYISEEVLSKIPEIKWNTTDYGFQCSDARLYTYLKPLGDAYSKYIPEEAKKLDSDCLKELLFWFCIGDGRMVDTRESSEHVIAERAVRPGTFKEEKAKELRDGHQAFTRRDVFSVSRRLIDDLHECLVRSGGCGSLSTIYPDADYEFAGRTIKAEDKVPLHQLHVSSTENIHLDARFLKVDKIHHNGNIYCLTTTHGNFYMEQNGHSFWTGNSDGRTQLTRTSHVITHLEVTPEGLVIGEAEILDTERGKTLKALMQAGCRVGVSSRGYGSTKTNVQGEDEVQDDYRLVTYDFVAEPADVYAYPQVFFEGKGNMKSSEMAPEVKKLIEDARIEERSKLQEDFAKEMVDQLSKLKVEMRENLRSEMLSDPEIASAKSVLEQIKPLLRPFILPEDAEAVVKLHESDKAKLRAQIADKDLKIASLEEERNKLADVAKEVGYKYFLEQKISDDADAAVIRRMVGNVKSYANSKEIEAKITAIKSELSEQRARREAAEKSLNEERAKVEQNKREMQEMIAAEQNALIAKNKTLAEALEKSVLANKQLILFEYANRKLTNNPKAAKIRSVVERANVGSTEEIDQIIESFKEVTPRDTADYEQVRARVRSMTKGGSGSTPLEEETPRPKGRQTQESQTNVGLDIGSFRKLSGIPGK